MKLLWLLLLAMVPLSQASEPAKDGCSNQLRGMVLLKKEVRLNRDGVAHFCPLERDRRGTWDESLHAFWSKGSRLLRKEARLELVDGTTIEGKITKLLTTMTSFDERGSDAIAKVWLDLGGGDVREVSAEEIQEFYFRPHRRDLEALRGAYPSSPIQLGSSPK